MKPGSFVPICRFCPVRKQPRLGSLLFSPPPHCDDHEPSLGVSAQWALPLGRALVRMILSSTCLLPRIDSALTSRASNRWGDLPSNVTSLTSFLSIYSFIPHSAFFWLLATCSLSIDTVPSPFPQT